MEIDYTIKFKKQHKRLPKDIQEKASRQLSLLLQNPRHPSLRLHKMEGFSNMWEISITMSYRVMFTIEGDKYVLFKIGKHDILKKLAK